MPQTANSLTPFNHGMFAKSLDLRYPVMEFWEKAHFHQATEEPVFDTWLFEGFFCAWVCVYLETQ